MGDLEVYFDPAVAMEERIIFSKYVHEHLLQHARDVERLRHYVCPQCGTPVGNREVAMKRLNDWLRGAHAPRVPFSAPSRKTSGELEDRSGGEPSRTRGASGDTRGRACSPSIICVGCEQRVPLWDEMEQCFASPKIQQQVRDLQEESAIELSNQSKERALVGEVISTVALADQISRGFNVSDQGIDLEIEFTDDAHEATGANVDPGHFVAGNNTSPVPFIKQHHERITHVHLKDRKLHNGPNVPFGEGDTPIAEVLRLIRDNHWNIQATIEFEYKIPAGSDRMKEIARAIKYCREALA